LANLAVFFVLWRLDRPAPIVPKPNGPVSRDFTPNLVTLDYANKEVRVFQRGDDGNWGILQPFIWPANKFAVQAIYTSLQLIDPDTNTNIPKDQLTSQSYKDFGLDQPILKVTLADDTHKQTLWVGQPTVRGGNVYTMNPDDRNVWVVAQSVLASLFAPMEDMRDKNIFRTQNFDAQSLSIRSPKLVKFVKDGDAWMLDTPLIRHADTAKVNGVVSDLHALQVKRFLTPAEADQARPSLANPNLTIELQGESSQTLDLGDDVPAAPGAPPEIYAQLEGSKVIFTLLKADLPATLLHAQDALRQRQFLDFDPAKVTSLDLSSPDGEVRLERLETRAWQVNDKDHPFDADSKTVLDLLDSLQQLTAKNFASDAPGDLAPFGLDHPLSKVVLDADNKVLPLDLGRDTPEDSPSSHYYAKIEGTGTDADTVYEIDREIFDQLDSHPLHFRDRVLESLPVAAQITSLKLTHLSDNQEVFTYTLPDNSTWDDYLHSALHDTDIIKREPLLDVCNFVKKAVVQDYRAAAYTDDYQISTSPTTPPILVPWIYRLDAGVQIPAAGSTAAQNKTLTFYFSDAFPHGLQIGGAKEPAPGAVFDLPPALVFDLSVLTIEPTRPAVVQQTLDQISQPINPRPAPPDASPAPLPAQPAPATPPPPATVPATPAPSAPPPAPAEAAPAAAVPAATSFVAPVISFSNFLIPNS
jgi:hypothetical protein